MGLFRMHARKVTLGVLLCVTAILSCIAIIQTTRVVISKHQSDSGQLTQGESCSCPQSEKLQGMLTDVENSPDTIKRDVATEKTTEKKTLVMEPTSGRLTHAESYSSPPRKFQTGTRKTNVATKKTALLMKPTAAKGFENSKVFMAFVKKQAGRYTSVAKYLDSTKAYLLSFVSPMIKETSNEYSWPETEEETRQRLSSSKNGRPTIKSIVWYDPPPGRKHHPSDGIFDLCPVKDCQMSSSYKEHRKADAVVFHQVPPKDRLPPRDHKDQMYVFNVKDSPVNRFSGFHEMPYNNDFNWTFTYYVDSDIFTPVAYLTRSPSIPTHSQLLKLMHGKTKMVAWFVSHCETQSLREKYVERLQKIVPVDIYGKCGPMYCARKTTECLEMLNDYFFYLSFENSICEDYITEKFYKTYFKGVNVVSVVRGGANYSRYFPEGTFIDAHSFTSPEELGQYLLALASDRARYVDLLWRRSHFVRLEHGNADANCKLCYKLHHLDRFKNSYSDLHGWIYKHKCTDPKL